MCASEAGLDGPQCGDRPGVNAVRVTHISGWDISGACSDAGAPAVVGLGTRENGNRMEKHMQPANIARQYDFIVCGSGSSGSVVAARAAENPDVRVLLVEAGGTDDALDVVEPGLWSTNPLRVRVS
jgi:hypothetical protein